MIDFIPPALILLAVYDQYASLGRLHVCVEHSSRCGGTGAVGRREAVWAWGLRGKPSRPDR